MSVLNWNSQWETGIEEIDLQHKKLVSIINSFYEKMNSGNFNDAFRQSMQGMHYYFLEHFTDEEKYMEESNYSGLSEHQKVHKDAIKLLDHFLETFEKEKRKTQYEFMNFLTIWIIEHLSGHDRKFGIYMHEHPELLKKNSELKSTSPESENAA